MLKYVDINIQINVKVTNYKYIETLSFTFYTMVTAVLAQTINGLNPLHKLSWSNLTVLYRNCLLL